MKPFLKGERGSFTVEATLVFPAFLMFVLAGVFLCIVIFQMGTAHYTAQKAASQVAYTWNNSKKDLETGEFEKHLYPGIDTAGDGLYWRIFDNGILGMFGLDGGVFSPAEEGVLMNKIRKAELNYNNALTVNVDYNNYIIYSEVTATAKTELFMPQFLREMLGGSDSLTAESTHVVTETPELIRTYNFANYLWKATGLADATQDILDSISDFFS